MNSKMNILLNDISNAADQGILSGTEDAAQAALEKIHAAIASVLPVDATSTASDGAVAIEYRTPQHVLDFIANIANVPFTDMADPELLKRISETHRLVPTEPQGYDKFLTVADGVKLVRFRGKDETRLVARRKAKDGNANAIFEIKVDHDGNEAEVYRDGKLMYCIQGVSIGHGFVEKLAISSLRRYFKTNKQTLEKRKRKRAKKAVEKAAAQEGVA